MLGYATKPTSGHSRHGRKKPRRPARRTLFVESLEDRRMMAAEVFTDKPDYSPGETAQIYASGFQAGETVDFLVVHIDGTPNTGGGHEPWQVADGSAEDLDGIVDGNVHTVWYVNPDDSLNSTFQLTAVGLSSGESAATTFTDDTPIPNRANPVPVTATYNPVTDELGVTVNWEWLSPPNTQKVVTAAVFADLNGDGLVPDATSNPATWVASTTSGDATGTNLPTPSDEFLGQIASSSINGTTSTGDSTDTGIASLAFTYQGLSPNTPGVLFPYDLNPQSAQGVTGTFTLNYTNVTVVDPFVSNLTRVADASGDGDNLLEVGETWAYTASHSVTQAEIDAGVNIVNTATADSDQTGPDSDDASIPVTQQPSLDIVKGATVPGGAADVVGELISYTITVQNTGNQTLTGVTVVDPFVSNLVRGADAPGRQ